MKKVMKKDLEKIKKIYGFERKTELTNAKAAVVKALPIEEKEVVFVMDRFGYSKILDQTYHICNKLTDICTDHCVWNFCDNKLVSF